MAREVYFREDILNALRSAHVASGGSDSFCEDAEKLRIYREGFDRALVAVGLAFGLESAEGTKLLQQERAPAFDG